MMVEIPDPVVILGLVLAFLGGLVTLFVYSRLKAVSTSNEQIKADSERLKFYERQLIDLKIKLDAIDLENLTFAEESAKNHVTVREEKPVPVVEKPVEIVQESIPVQLTQAQRTPNLGHNDAVKAVLGLITDKSRTSRDIQITLGKSREHISRMMKKLYEDGLVERNVNTKPYTYSITQIGLSRLGGTGPISQSVAPQAS
tara:strand:- start:3576 stop:4175 length:600 start_codon:yes stop_codon:yes gene_type:complete